MANVVNSPNMNLPIPQVGIESGPAYATDVNNCLGTIDQHNHTLGSGVQITPAAINVNSPLTMSNNFLINTAGITLFPQVSTPAINTVYEAGVDLYYVDGNGNNIRITQSGNVAGAAGTITGLPSGTASASFAAATFTFQAATLTPANVDGGSFIFRNNVASSKGLTLSPPSAMGSNYSLTLPQIPGANSFLTIDTSGNMSGSIPTSAGITGSMIAASTISGSNIVNNVNLIGNNVAASGRNIVVSSGNATNALAILRGGVTNTGSVLNGEGFSPSRASLGVYNISFNNAFNDAPAIVVTNSGGSNFIPSISVTTPINCQISFRNPSGAMVDSDFFFIIIGQRN